MKGFRRQRLEKEIFQVITTLFNGKITDPRLDEVEITRVKLTPDLSLLKLYYYDTFSKSTQQTILEQLNKCSGYIKKQIAGACTMRSIPQIVFEYDNSKDRVEKIDELFKIIAEEKRNNNYYDDDSDNKYYDDDDELLEEELEDYDDYNDDLNFEKYDYEEEDLEEDDEVIEGEEDDLD